jgi:asparagine synthase (glutamine-hydrolysing)
VPYALKQIDSVGKQPLRQLLYRYVPRDLIDRPKRGFAVPLAAWLRGPLRPWAEELLSSEALTRGGVLDIGRVRRIWSQHTAGIANHAERLWTVLSLQAFFKRHGLD